MFWRQKPRARIEDAGDAGELEEITQLVAAALALVDPDPVFAPALRDRLMVAASNQVARRMEAEERYRPVRRGVLVGAGAAAAVSLAGAALVFWRRNHPGAFGPQTWARGA